MAKSKTSSIQDKKVIKVAFPSKYSQNAIIGYVAEKNDISKKDVKQLLDDLYAVIDAGIQKGQRVPIGFFGKMFIKIRPAAPARKGRNPATGEEIMLKARPKMKVPKFSFTKNFKEKVKNS